MCRVLRTLPAIITAITVKTEELGDSSLSIIVKLNLKIVTKKGKQ